MAELLELSEAALDEVPLFVEPLGVADSIVAVGARRNVGPTIPILNHVPDPVGVVTLVGDDVGPRRQRVEQQFGHGRVVRLARRQLQLHRQAVADHARVQLGGQSSTASTDTSFRRLFFWAAAC